MNPGQLVTPGQVSNPGVHFASVYGLTSASVHVRFSLPGVTERRRLPAPQHQVTHLKVVTFLHVNKGQMLPWDKTGFVHAHY